eukprot:scaffold70946_cov18-Prasinocladus_malaysianus.AAC.2
MDKVGILRADRFDGAHWPSMDDSHKDYGAMMRRSESDGSNGTVCNIVFEVPNKRSGSHAGNRLFHT